MKFSALLLLPIFLVVLAHQAQSQNRFIVAVLERVRGTNNTRTRCPGTIITERHVLTTADCAQPSNSSYEILVQVQMVEQLPGGVSSGSITVSTERVFLHPNRTDASYNFGVIKIDGRFNTTLLPPRSLGSTNSNATCILYGWYGALEVPESVSVQVFSPTFCNPSQSQTFCSVLPSNTARACNAAMGSPLVCSTGSVNAILISPTTCEYDQLGRQVLRYNSVGDSMEWIKEVSGAGITKFSVVLLVTAVLVALKIFV